MLDFLFPPACTVCSQSLRNSDQPWLCNRCRVAIHKIGRPRCDRCLQPFLSQTQTGHLCARCLRQTHHDKLYSVGAYSGTLSELILGLKFGKRLDRAPVLGGLLIESIRDQLRRSTYDVVVPVPVHSKTLRRRGFNQAQLIAQSVAKFLRLPLNRFGLKKTAATPEQARLTERERAENLRNAFQSAPSFYGKSCLLVDDVYTTGATAESCAASLKEAGAIKVDVLTVARTI